MNACAYHRFVPGSWDDMIWDFVAALLSDNSWIEEQLAVEQEKSVASMKLVDIEQRRIAQIQSKIAKIQEGFEAGIYSLDDARNRIRNYQRSLTKAEQEIEQLHKHSGRGINMPDIDTLRQELKALAEKNLDEASFGETREIISKLDIKVYPSEDLKTIRIKCGINLTCDQETDNGAIVQCGKIILGPPGVSIGRSSAATFVVSDIPSGVMPIAQFCVRLQWKEHYHQTFPHTPLAEPASLDVNLSSHCSGTTIHW